MFGTERDERRRAPRSPRPRTAGRSPECSRFGTWGKPYDTRARVWTLRGRWPTPASIQVEQRGRRERFARSKLSRRRRSARASRLPFYECFRDRDRMGQQEIVFRRKGCVRVRWQHGANTPDVHARNYGITVA